MKPIAKFNLKFNGVYYNKGEELKVENKNQLIWLNENGFIEPFTPKEIQDFEINKTKKYI